MTKATTNHYFNAGFPDDPILRDKNMIVRTDVDTVRKIVKACLKPEVSPLVDSELAKKIGIKSTSAQITNYSVDQLIGRQIVGICNLPSKNIAGFVSEVLVLGAVLEEEVHLLRTDDKLENGTLIG